MKQTELRKQSVMKVVAGEVMSEVQFKKAEDD